MGKEFDSIDQEFNDFLDEHPIYDPVLLEFNRVTAWAYAFRAAEEYQHKLESMLGTYEDTQAYLDTCRVRDELKYAIIDSTGSDPALQDIENRKEARDRAKPAPRRTLEDEVGTRMVTSLPRRLGKETLAVIFVGAYAALAAYVAYWATH